MLTDLLPDGNIRLRKDLVVRLICLKYTVPKGFVTDGASIPWFLGFIGNHYEGDTLEGAIIHDAIYSTKGKVLVDGEVRHMSRLGADYTLYSILREYSSKWKARVYYWVVRLGGWYPWYFGKHKKNGKILSIKIIN